MHCAILINRHAGTLLSRGPRAVVESLRRQIDAEGATGDIRLLHPAAMTSALKAARDDEYYDAVIVGGGDGTISSARAFRRSNSSVVMTPRSRSDASFSISSAVDMKGLLSGDADPSDPS